MKRARSIARRHELKSVIVAARNGVLPKRYVKMAARTLISNLTRSTLFSIITN
jgi:hypothetical protein